MNGRESTGGKRGHKGGQVRQGVFGYCYKLVIRGEGGGVYERTGRIYV